MNRRGFLASAIAAALAPKELIAPVVRQVFEASTLAPALSEAALEEMMIEISRNSIGPLVMRPTQLVLAEQLRPAIEAWFDRIYREHGAEWKTLFDDDDDGVSLFSSVHPTCSQARS